MRIAIDPADLRSTASKLRAEADRFESLGGQVGGMALPEMPPAVQTQVAGRLRATASALRLEGREMDAMATALDRRAALALLAAIGGGLSDWGAGLGGNDPRSGLIKLLLKFIQGGSKDFFSSGAFRDGKGFHNNKGKLWHNGRLSKNDLFFSQEGRWSKTFGDWEDSKDKMFGGVGMSKTFKLFDEKVWGVSGDNYDLAVLAAEAEAKRGIKWTGDSIDASAEAAAAAYLLRGSVGFKTKHVQAQAGASVGANAKGSIGARFGKDGVTAKAGGEAFVGGEAHAGGGVSAAGVTTKANAGVSYGLGAKATGEADLGLDKVKVKAQIGATLGLGVNVGVDVEVKPLETVNSVASGAKDLVSKIPHPW